MQKLKELRPGIEYVLLTKNDACEVVPLFVGVAGYITDDFIAAGVIQHTLSSNRALGIHTNEENDDDFVRKMRSIG